MIEVGQRFGKWTPEEAVSLVGRPAVYRCSACGERGHYAKTCQRRHHSAAPEAAA